MNSARNLFNRKSGGNVGRSMLVASLSVAAIATSVTGAYFTDSDAPTGSGFTTGDVNLALSASTAIVANANMAPGDVEYGTVTVSNSGSLELRYALKSVTTENVLAAQLDLTVWDESAEADVGTDCSTTVPATTLYAAADLGSTTGVKVFGDAATGAQAGDRTLAATASEVLCFKASLPSSTGNSFESLTTTATFTFDSEQTANNA
ncbi:MAG: M73 family metallopeptidase [Actinobacteria bacterium]|nr:M73 family metallopeptidase [Actinomycetota bacterium]